MPSALANSNYEPELPRRDAGSAPATGSQRLPASNSSKPATDAVGWSPDFALVQDFLQLLARAVRQFHTYPPTSPLCLDAITACRNALVLLQTRDRVGPFRRVGERICDGGLCVLDAEDVGDIRASRGRQLARGDAGNDTMADFAPGETARGRREQRRADDQPRDGLHASSRAREGAAGSRKATVRSMLSECGRSRRSRAWLFC